MVFQHFNLFPHLTVLQNMTLAPVQLKMPTRTTVMVNLPPAKPLGYLPSSIIQTLRSRFFASLTAARIALNQSSER